MCGIFACISAEAYTQAAPDCERCLQSRGPDYCNTVQTQHGSTASPLFLTFTSTVLALRGNHVAKQPLVDQTSGSALCWNGEAWKINEQPVQGNDGEAVLTLLTDASAGSDSKNRVLSALRAIEGPFAFAFFDKPSRSLYYGRDRLGRRSLLRRGGLPFSLSSIAETTDEAWDEVEADGFYVLELDSLGVQNPTINSSRYSWSDEEALVSGLAIFNDDVPTNAFDLVKESPSVSQLRWHLTESLRPRVSDVPVPPGATVTDARVAILFSGGVDCTVLARLASEAMPSEQTIDLINVAFENPRIAAQYSKNGTSANIYETCPDRITGRKSFAELQSACPAQSWRFVTVDVPFQTCAAHRAEVIRLIYPHNTEMDLSIAFALYFAARGQGACQTHPDPQPQPYNTTARVLLSGLGADELFGGYVRHATAFSRRGYPGLIEELKLDVGRLGKRNLGRDDRVMAHWGREVRFPYLDERLARWAVELPVWEKCDFENREEAGGGFEPGKRILRLLADELGMGRVAREKKRAIQFGARTAKMESGKVKGTTVITS